MDFPNKYIELINERGIISFNYEIALTAKDALYAIDLLKESLLPILGGDIVTKNDSGSLVYAIHDWGESYIYLNFYCDKEESENKESYVDRSHGIAKKSINEAISVAENLDKECYIVLVV